MITEITKFDTETQKLLDEAKQLKCSKRLISNLEISGEFCDLIALEEEVQATKRFFLKEQERKSQATFLNSLIIFASEKAVKEVNQLIK